MESIFKGDLFMSMRHLVCLALLFTFQGLLISCGGGGSRDSFLLGNIIVDQGFDDESAELLIRDWEQFDQKLSLTNQSAEAQKLTTELGQIMEIDSVTKTSLQAWLDQRIKYILNKDFDLKSVTVLQESYEYEYPFRDFDVEELSNKFSFQNAEEEKDDSEAQLLMQNAGTYLYAVGKKKKALLGLRLNNGSLIELRSPRVGIIQVGPALNTWHEQEKKTIEKTGVLPLFPSMVRLTALWHEARHSDGHDYHLGFGHSTCPKYFEISRSKDDETNTTTIIIERHPYGGELLCDKYENGPNAISYRLLKLFGLNCEHCSEPDHAAIDSYIADFKIRVMSSRNNHEDHVKHLKELLEERGKIDTDSDMSEEKQKELDEKIAKTELSIEMTNPTPDPTPEGTI